MYVVVVGLAFRLLRVLTVAVLPDIVFLSAETLDFLKLGFLWHQAMSDSHGIEQLLFGLDQLIDLTSTD